MSESILQPKRRQLIKLASASLFLLVSPAGRAAVGQLPGILAVRV